MTINTEGREILADKKSNRTVSTSPRIVSQIDLLRMVKSGTEGADKEIIKRLKNKDSSGEQSRD